MSLSDNNSNNIQRHLDSAGTSYLSSINDTRPESAVDMAQRLSPLLQFLKPGSSVVSIGVGQGEELCSLYDLFQGNIKIIAVDISQVALEQARSRVERNSFDVSFIHADAKSIPLDNESVDGVILSSTLHEVYSYNPDGFNSFLTCLNEVDRILKKEGVVFIRDFASPDRDDLVTIRIRTPIAIKFYEWFHKNFRQLNSWGDDMKKHRLNESFLPSIGNGIIRLPLNNAAELLLHFRSFWSDYQKGDIRIGDSDWKESDELYLIRDKKDPLTPNQYLKVINDTLGKNFDIGTFTYINSKYGIKIEDEVQIGSHCSIYSHSSIDNKKGAIILKKNCKIGTHSTIMPNVTIGENSIIAAYSFVTKNVPKNEIWSGVPAKFKIKISDHK